MKIGYARVSTKDQSFDLQIDALSKDGCEKIYRETASGAKDDRPALRELLAHIRIGDIVVVWKLDRLGRSLRHLVDLVSVLNQKNVGLRSLNDPIDTSTAQGRLIFNLFGSLAEFEREMIVERTRAGLAAARARGRMGGRKKGLSDTAILTAIAAKTLYQSGTMSVKAIVKQLNISKSTLYNYLRHQGVQISPYTRK